MTDVKWDAMKEYLIDQWEKFGKTARNNRIFMN